MICHESFWIPQQPSMTPKPLTSHQSMGLHPRHESPTTKGRRPHTPTLWYITCSLVKLTCWSRMLVDHANISWNQMWFCQMDPYGPISDKSCYSTKRSPMKVLSSRRPAGQILPEIVSRVFSGKHQSCFIFPSKENACFQQAMQVTCKIQLNPWRILGNP